MRVELSLSDAEPHPAAAKRAAAQVHRQQNAHYRRHIGVGDEVAGQWLLYPARRSSRLVRPALEQHVGPVLRPDLVVDNERPAACQGQQPIDLTSLASKYCATPWNGHERARTHAIRSRYYPASVAVRAGRGASFSNPFRTSFWTICGNSQARSICCYRVEACNMTCNAETRRKPPLLQRYRCYRSLIGSSGLMG